MNRFCDYKPCQFYLSQPNYEQKLKLVKVMCPLCMNTNYCSSRCRDLDWLYHKNNCKKQIPDRSRSCNDYDESVSTVSARRRPEEFEVIQVGNKSELGRGSYGCVKLVKDRTNGQMYAMKIMNKRSVFEYCSVENLKREIKIQRKLMHVHICKLFHYFEDKENVYLILEYAQNGSLFNYIKKRQKLPENEAFVYFFQTCLGIDYLHKNRIIHRDLKPENLLLDHTGNIKICDFGWSAESLAEKRTTFCGTYEYMAPEMLNKSPHDFSLDVWSLGILLFELIHGHAPYRGRTNEELCQKIKSGTPIIFSHTCSLEGQNLIKKILKYNPADRPSMGEIFDHPWMQRNAKFYKIDIWSYVYKSSQPTRQLPAPISSQTLDMNKNSSNNITHQKKNYQQQISQDYKFEQEITKPRISRVSQNRHEIQHQQQQEQQLGFMDRVFLAFGCLNREKK